MTESVTTDLTQEQRQVLQAMNDFLLQFSDREQMNAASYLAKYRGCDTCESLAVPLRWRIQEVFNGN